MAQPDDVVVGVVSKAFGIRGDVYVHPDPDVAEDFPAGRSYTATRGHEERSLVVAASHLHSGRRVVRFEGVTDRNTAEALRGFLLRVPADAVALDEDTFWSGDILGAEVVDDAGGIVGVVEGVLDGPAHDYLVIARPDGGEVLVPAVADLVDVQPQRVVVHAIPGLLDDNEA
jgi:16S rRNA processing protein RimM